MAKRTRKTRKIWQPPTKSGLCDDVARAIARYVSIAQDPERGPGELAAARTDLWLSEQALKIFLLEVMEPEPSKPH